MVLEIVDKNVFEIMTLPNNLVLICRFKDHNLVFCSLCMICLWNICFLPKYGLWKLQIQSWNANHESLIQILTEINSTEVFSGTNLIRQLFKIYNISAQNRFVYVNWQTVHEIPLRRGQLHWDHQKVEFAEYNPSEQ